MIPLINLSARFVRFIRLINWLGDMTMSEIVLSGDTHLPAKDAKYLTLSGDTHLPAKDAKYLTCKASFF